MKSKNVNHSNPVQHKILCLYWKFRAITGKIYTKSVLYRIISNREKLNTKISKNIGIGKILNYIHRLEYYLDIRWKVFNDTIFNQN